MNFRGKTLDTDAQRRPPVPRLFQQAVFLGLCAATLIGCGRTGQFNATNPFSKEKPTPANELGLPPNATSNEKVDITLALVSESAEGAQLLAVTATSMVVDVTGCSSGYGITAHNTAVSGSTIALYKADRGCTPALKSFVWSARTWTKVGGGGYTGGPSTLFQNGADRLTVTLYNGLTSPLAGNETVSFAFAQVQSGTARKFISTESAQKLTSMTNAHDAPAMRLKTISGVALNTIASPSNVATFDVTLECESLLTTANSVCPTQNLQNQFLNNFRLAIVKDTYGGVLTWAQAQSAIDAATNVVNIANGNRLAPAGGFNGGTLSAQNGPEDLTTSKNMILIIEHDLPSSTDRSYTYINIDFTLAAALNFLPSPDSMTDAPDLE